MKMHLRDLFWLLLVCALIVAWWMDRRRSATLEAGLRYNLNGLKRELGSVGKLPFPEK